MRSSCPPRLRLPPGAYLLPVCPSQHDSSGNAVPEALSRGLPVMCLDIGCPCEIVTPDCGLIVATSSRTAPQVAQSVAEDMLTLFADPIRLFALSAVAIARAWHFNSADRVARFYALVAGLMRERQVSVGLPVPRNGIPEPSAG